MTTHDVLVKAKAYLLEHGWRQGDYGEHGGPRCLIGALGSACGHEESAESFDSWPWPLGLEYAVGVARGITGPRVPQWNDDPQRTLADVIAVLDEAIIATAPAQDREAVTA